MASTVIGLQLSQMLGLQDWGLCVSILGSPKCGSFESTFLFFFFFVFLGPLPRHMEIPRLGARGLLGAVATGLCHSHSNARSEPHLRPTPQFTATLDP